MSGKFYNLDTRNTLGGEKASDLFVASQKAVKDYVDEKISTIIDTNTDQLVDLKDVKITNVANGQSLVYDSTTSKWINKAIDTSGATWGKITGTLTSQTDLKDALDGKSDIGHTHTKANITDFPTKLSAFTDDLGSTPTHTHSQYITEHQDISGKQDTITSTNKLSSDLVDDTNNTHKFVTAIQIESWNDKQDAINDLDTIRQNASSALHSGDNISSLVNDSGYLTSEDISSVFVYKGTKANQAALPTTGNKKGDVWTVSDTGSEYVWNGTSWEYLGQILDLSGYQTLITNTNKLSADLLSEGSTNKLVSATEKATWSGKQDALTEEQIANIAKGGTALQPNDNVSELNNDAGYLTEHQDISGKQDVIDSTHKLSADLVDDSTSTNKFVTAANKTTWNNKQNAITDLETIRANATAGKSAKDAVDAMGDIVSHNVSEFQEAGDYATAEHTHAIADITNLQTTLNNKQATIQDLDTIRANATAGAGAATTIAGYGDIVTHNANEFLTQHQSLDGKQDKITTSNKLSADLVQNGTTNKVVTQTEKDTWNAKQNALSTTQLSNIDKGGTAVQPEDLATVATSGSYNDLDNKPTIPTVPTNVSAFNNDAGYLTDHQDISGKQDKITNTNKLNADLLSEGTTNKLVSATEKSTWNNKLDSSAISDMATKTWVGEQGYLTDHQDISGKANTSDLAKVATTGSYNDLLNKPTIPSAVTESTVSGWGFTKNTGTVTKVNNVEPVNGNVTISIPTVPTNVSAFTNDAGYLTSHQSLEDYAKTEDLAKVATSGSYDDLTNKPTIPTVGNAEIEIQKNGTKVDSFTTNQSGNKKTINITVPTQASDIGAAESTHSHTSSQISDLSTTISSAISGKANSSEVYTKSEIDGKLASGMHYKGTKASVSELPATGNEIGDLWNVTDTGANYAWNGTEWDKLSENIDLSGYVPTSRTVNGKALTQNISLTYSDVSAASASHTHDYVPTSRKINGKTLTADITLSVADIGAAASSHNHVTSDVTALTGYTIATTAAAIASTDSLNVALGKLQKSINGKQASGSYVPTSRKINGKTLTADVTLTASDVSALPADTEIPTVPTNVSAFNNDAGYLTSHQSLTDYQKTNTAVTHTASTAVGNTITPVYVASDGKATALNYTIAKSVPADANFSNTTYTAGTGLTLSGTQFKHSNAVTAGTVGTSAATSGSTLAVPYVTYDAQGHVTATGTHTHTVSGFVPTSRKINGNALSADVTLSASDVGAATSDHTHTGYATTTHKHLTSDVTALSGYTIATTAAAIASTDSLNVALGKIQKSLDSKQASGSYVPTSRKINGKTLTADVTLTYSDVSAASSTHTHTYSDVGAASSAHTHSEYAASTHNHVTSNVTALTGYTIATTAAAIASTDSLNVALGKLQKSIDGKQASGSYVPTSRTVNGKALSGNITLSASDVSAAAADHTHTYSDVGAASESHTHSGYQSTSTAVTHTANTAVGNTITPVYIATDGKATALGYTIAKSVPADANFSNTTYSAGTGLSLSGTTINHGTTITAGTAGTNAATSGNTLAVPYVTYNNTGHITAVGTHTHTITGFLTSSSTLDATKLSGTIPTGCYTNTTYSAGTGLSMSGTTINHAASITAGTAGTTAATSGSVISVPYVTYNASGHVTAAGVRNHTVSAAATAIEVDGVTSGSSGINRYCNCSTAAGTAAKTANVTAGTFALKAGSRVTVKFANANTADTPTLNINSTGAKNIFLLGTQITTGSNKGVIKGMVDFVYDGTQWHVMSITPITVSMMV